METARKNEQHFEMADDLLQSIHHKIDEGTQQLIQRFQKSADDVRSGMEKEFAEKPWTMFFSVLGLGLVLGYGLAHSNSKTDLQE